MGIFFFYCQIISTRFLPKQECIISFIVKFIFGGGFLPEILFFISLSVKNSFSTFCDKHGVFIFQY